MSLKVGDRVIWISSLYPHYYGRTATVAVRKVNGLVHVRWDHIPTKGYQGPWFHSRFDKLPDYTPLEAQVQEYIRSEREL